MSVSVAKASTVFVQQVPPAAVERFLQWQRGVTAAVQEFPGFQGTDLYPPAGGHEGEWVAVIHFDDDESLQGWLGSPVRARWVEKLRAGVGEFELKTLTGGFSQWFAAASRDARQTPPAWKMALTVLLGLYPTVMLLTIFVSPLTSPLGLAFSMLIGNALSVAILQWLLMPALTRLLAPWLESKAIRRVSTSFGALAAIVVLLAGLAIVFRRVTG